MTAGAFAQSLIFEHGSPPEKPTLVFAREVDGARVRLMVDESGSFRLEAHAPNELIQSFSFVTQPVHIPKFALVWMIVQWSTPAYAEIELCGIRLQGLWQSREVVRLDSAPTYPQKFDAPIFPDLDPIVAVDEIDRFLLETIAELDKYAHSQRDYDLKRSGGLLRLILLEQLHHKVNKRYNAPIVFRISAHPEMPRIPDTALAQISLDPSVPTPNGAIEVVDQKRFLGTSCIWRQDQSITVAEVIKVCANTLGGVHFGEPNSPHDAALIEVARATALSGPSRNALLTCVSGIARVTLVALGPLVEAIREKRFRERER